MMLNKAGAAYYKSISSSRHKNREVKTKNLTLSLIFDFLLPNFFILSVIDLLGFVRSFETIMKKALQKP